MVRITTTSFLVADPAVVRASEAVANLTPVREGTPPQAAARRALLARLAAQPASGQLRSWQRDDLYD